MSEGLFEHTLVCYPLGYRQLLFLGADWLSWTASSYYFSCPGNHPKPWFFISGFLPTSCVNGMWLRVPCVLLTCGATPGSTSDHQTSVTRPWHPKSR